MRQDYSKKFRSSMMKKKNKPLFEEGGEVDEPAGVKSDYTMEFPDSPTFFGDSAKEVGEDSGKDKSKKTES